MTCSRAIRLIAAACMVVGAILPASAQSNVADLSISAVMFPNPAPPGAELTYSVFVQNQGPNPSLPSGTITGTFPGGVTPADCFAQFLSPFRGAIIGSCLVNGQSFTATVPEGLFTWAATSEEYMVSINATLTASAPSGTAFTATFSVSAASLDPNPSNNATTLTVTTPAPLSITVSPKLLSFAYVALNNPGLQSITITNAGKSFFWYNTPVIGGNFTEIDDSCTGQFNTMVLVPPGGSCVATIQFVPTTLGTANGSITFSETDRLTQSAQQVVALSGVGSNVGLVPGNVTFPTPQMDGTSSFPVQLSLLNVGNTAVPVGTIQTSAAFTQTNDCGGVVQAQSRCNIFLTFTPSTAGPITGTLYASVQAPGSPFVANLNGIGSAVKLTPAAGVLDLGSQDIGTSSDPFPVTLTNASTQPLRLNGISTTGTGFHEKDDCPRRLRAGASCTISTVFRPTFDGGPEQGSLTIDAQDPLGQQTFRLSGTGIGISHNVVWLHYDYMVAADHTHDPEVVAPGAIQAVVDAFAKHGIRLIIDPRHTAIPETPLLVFGPEKCASFLGPSVNFDDLKAQYFASTNARVHYSIFGHYIASGAPGNPFRCDPFAFSGISELPGQNFVNGLYFITLDGGYTPSMARMALASSYMHELGHNFGLHHGGGIGPLGTDSDDFQRNFKPNYISVMNYNYLFSGIPVADAAGSVNFKACTTDHDCAADDGLCTDTALAAPFPAKACFRLDYSRQVLPAGGNTPGALDENANLDETAGLGSGNADITFFTDARCNGQIVPSNGPLDFDGDGSATNAHAAADLIPVWWETLGLGPGCAGRYVKLGGFNDWSALTDRVDDIETQNSLNAGAPRDFAREVDLPTLKSKHLLYPPRQVVIAIHPGCGLASAPLASGQPGTVSVAILGNASLDVNQIDPQSLRLHGVAPLSTSIVDVNADGQLDLLVTFDASQIHLSPQATTIRLSGWMKNSQRFWATAPVTIVNDMNTQPAACRN